MKFTTDAAHTIGRYEGVPVDGVVPAGLRALSAGGWDFWDESGRLVMGYGGFNGIGGPLGLYSYDLVTQILTRLGDQYAAQARAFYCANGTWLGDFTNGARDSNGNAWLDGSGDARSAVYLASNGDQLFVSKPDFQSLIVRRPDGTESHYTTGPIQDAHIDGGVVLYARGGAPTAIGAPTPVLPSFLRFCHRPDGTRVMAGYAPGWGLVVANWDSAPTGYVLSGDGLDFNPAVGFRQADGMVVVASSATSGDTARRLYEVDLPGHRFRVNEGPWHALVSVNLLQPPADVPPPIPVPVPLPIPVPTPLPTPIPTPIPPPSGGPHMTYLSYKLVNGVATAQESPVIDNSAKFKQTGTCFAQAGPGFNAMVFGADCGNGLVAFQRVPMFVAGWDAHSPGDFGRLVPQPDGMVAIQWPV